MKGLDEQKSKLREDQTYADAVRNMLQDTGIKTKIIKQYLPIMNKLINTYLTSMEFYVNFTLNENLRKLSSHGIAMSLRMHHFQRVRRCVSTLHYSLLGDPLQR